MSHHLDFLNPANVEIKPEYEYFISIASGRYDDLDEAIKKANEYVINDISNCDYENIETIVVRKYNKDGDYIDIVHEANPLVIAQQIAKLTIELFQLENVQWSKNSDEQVRINELRKEINNLIL